MNSLIRLPFKDADVRRRDKGRKKPQAIRQAKKKTKQLKLEKPFSEMSQQEKSENWQSILKAYKK